MKANDVVIVSPLRTFRRCFENLLVYGHRCAGFKRSPFGHPVGTSGARITMTMMYELMRRGGGSGVAVICGGLSQGEAIIIKV
jgi:hypothetical protein